MEGKTAVGDLLCTGQPNESTSSTENVHQVQDPLEDDRRMTIFEICSQLQSLDFICTSRKIVLTEVQQVVT